MQSEKSESKKVDMIWPTVYVQEITLKRLNLYNIELYVKMNQCRA